ncbi:hypothetical protein ACHAXT_011642 [Thalassiosira profunda]
MSLCQVNNHPDFRLQLARAKVAARQMEDQGVGVGNPTTAGNKSNSTVQIFENPERSSDGTSSGALAADRLRMARRKAMESMGKVPPPAPPPPKWQRERAKRHGSKFHQTVKEHGLGIAVSENPVVSNDGTSSGALAADRLRMARRKAIQSLATPDPSAPTAMQEPEQAESTAARRLTNNAPVKETGLHIVSYENRARSSDGTSSGAKAADRLREARRKAIESMKKPASESVSDAE